MSFATLPDSGCGYTLSELNRLLGPILLLRSVISVILMTYKMKNMCCSNDVPIPRMPCLATIHHAVSSKGCHHPELPGVWQWHSRSLLAMPD
eukprot:1149215-Pelagomonas_calceolata.AAC.1